MPRIPRMIPADRCFARIDRFECECPDCGRLILPARQGRKLPPRLERSIGDQRDVARSQPAVGERLVYNPHTQLVRCTSCGRSYVVGLVLFPLRRGASRPVDAPIDAEPTRAQRLAMTRLAGGWAARQAYVENETQVNQVITQPCSCPARGAGDPTCPVHGTREAENRLGEGGQTEPQRRFPA